VWNKNRNESNDDDRDHHSSHSVFRPSSAAQDRRAVNWHYSLSSHRIATCSGEAPDIRDIGRHELFLIIRVPTGFSLPLGPEIPADFSSILEERSLYCFA
jgi:hypothetical protein